MAALGEAAGKRAVCWDIDGTLCDSFQLAFDATAKVLTSRGFPAPSAEEYHLFTKYTTPVRLARHCGLEPGTEEFERLGTELGAEFDELYIGLVDMQTAAFFPGIKDLLVDLGTRGVSLGALTNAAVQYAEAVLSCNEVRSHFTVVHGADDVPQAKPAPDGLLLCSEELGISASDCIYIGDSPSDGAAAKAAGMRSIGVTWGSHPVERVTPAFDVVVSTVDDLRSQVDEFLGNDGGKVSAPCATQNLARSRRPDD